MTLPKATSKLLHATLNIRVSLYKDVYIYISKDHIKSGFPFEKCHNKALWMSKRFFTLL